MKIKTTDDFKRWVRIEMAKQGTTQRGLAKELNVPETRISETVNGKPHSRKYIKPMVLALGGKITDFERVIGK